jgi:hypothetical protein
MNLKQIAALSLLAIAAFLRCSGNPTEVAQGGGGSEAVALVGTFSYGDKQPAVQARIHLRPRYFLSDTGRIAKDSKGFDAVTDANGSFRLDSLPPGEYFLEASDAGALGILIPCTLTGETAVVHLDTTKLVPTGAVTGSIVPPEGFAGRTYVQVYGLERKVKADSATGKFNLEGLPQGTYTLRAVYSAAVVDPREIDSVESKSADTTDIGLIQLASFENENYSVWPYSQRLYFNTTTSGANIPGGVEDFPVLVRLNWSNFDFAQGHSTDIRFSDSKGKRLRYEVERWDSASGQAEIWVRLDYISGNSLDQFLTLHWGLKGAPLWSDSRQVFVAEAGFAGVWHMQDEVADTISRGLYQDAVGYDPADDHIASTDRTGAIGYGHGFNSGDYAYIRVANPLLEPNLRLSLSAWVNASKTDALGSTILSMGDNYNLRINPNGSGRFSFFRQTTIAVETKGVNLLDSAWHHLAATFDGTILNIYVDGKLVGAATNPGGLSYSFYPSFTIGRHGSKKPGYDFTGNLDEVQVSGEVARSANWIKMSYENQKSNSKLLELRP